MIRSLSLMALLWTAFASVAPLEAAAQEQRSDWLDIELGKSIVLETQRVPTTISVTDPRIAFVQTLTAKKLQIQGTSIGTTDLVIQVAPDVPPLIYEITVHRDLSELIRRVDGIVAHDPPRVYPLQERIVVQGEVDDLITLERVAMVAQAYDANFINLMSVRGDHEVQLDVVLAEVSRTGLREMGFNAIWTNGDIFAALGTLVDDRSTGSPISTAAVSLPVRAGSPGSFSLLAFSLSQRVMGLINILDSYNLGKILEQTTLVCLSGQQGELLAGGRIPMPVPNTQGNIVISWQEFGTKLLFIPTVLANDVIDLQVQVEVSELDDASAARISGIQVPGLITRKAATHIRLESGMTFAIAGLLSENVSYSRGRVPGLGSIPVLGALFRTVQHQREETELVVIATPHLVRPMAPSEVPPLPGTTENNNPSDLNLFLMGLDRRPGSRTATPTGVVGLQR